MWDERERVEWSERRVRWRNVAREVRRFGEKKAREWDERG